MSTALKYVHQQLAATGFVIIDAEVAATLRPDLFSSGMEAGGHLVEARRRSQLGGASLKAATYCAELGELGRTVTVLARSPQRLQERITELTGYTVLGLEVEDTQDLRWRQQLRADDARAQEHLRRQAIHDEKLAKLRALAAQELPLHKCTVREDILRARRELAAQGEGVAGFVPA